MRILAIDDEPFMLKLLVRQLESLGYSDVIPHVTASDALAMLESSGESVGLIFLDLQMPQMDGVEMVRHLVRLGYSRGLVLVSGEDERILQGVEKLANAHNLDVLGALHKPVSTEQLQAVLQSNLVRTDVKPKESKTYEADELKHAIANGQLVAHFQPKVAVSSGALVGVEALARWQHPQDGLVFPDQFIPVAEQSSLIDDLTRAVLTFSLRQARLWRDIGTVLEVAVNISMENLKSLDFPEFVTQLAHEAGIPVSSLMLEVTESRLMSDPRASLDILTRLRLKRVGLSIDDFGTGHSSLAQLRDLPFQELKVDRSFVHGAWRNDPVRAIFEASLGMGHQLGMKIVAEGVEDRLDWDFLRLSGCDVAQGYFIAKPMAAAALSDWIAAWETRRPELTETVA